MTFMEIIDNLELHITTLLSNIYLKFETFIFHNKFYSIYIIDYCLLEVLLIIDKGSNFSFFVLKSV
jgi:hypothetical protein